MDAEERNMQKHLALDIVAACSGFVHVAVLQVIFVRA
jgi:hypothetical protein